MSLRLTRRENSDDVGLLGPSRDDGATAGLSGEDVSKVLSLASEARG